ncbi:MAG: glucose-6-phosphate isomerase [Gammaproteobacteria bacterium]|nr:glucose-6-phosphate isomerase [Gammaproteobacteria bacterium]
MTDRHLKLHLGNAEAAVHNTLTQLANEKFVQRLWDRDTTLWKTDADHRKTIGHRLGWLTAPASMRKQLPQISAFTDDVRKAGFTDAILLGMGGSSLAPEVFGTSFGPQAGYLRLHVLDSSNPDVITEALKRSKLEKSLFIVSSKSGTTTETLSLYRVFEAQLRRQGTARPGQQFIAITDPGTPLEQLAREHTFRRIFSNPADIGGRYSVLSYFGLVPAALLGIDLNLLLGRAENLSQHCGPEVTPALNPGVYLGAALAVLARRGQDKLTLLLSPSLASLGVWIEQLVAESTGKEGVGILPIGDESLGQTQNYGDDRIFVAITLAGDTPALDNHQLGSLVANKHPVISWTLPDCYDLGGEFLRWEIATATAGALLGVNPFDEPNVTESKDTTYALLNPLTTDNRQTSPQPVAQQEGVGLYTTQPPGDLSLGFEDTLSQFLATIQPRDYLALLAYLHPRHEQALNKIRLLLRNRLRIATTLGFGPRYLHSTGQFHKGGANHGVFIQITTTNHHDITIPQTPYSFGQLYEAQALGDFQVLQRRQRRVLRIHLQDDAPNRITALYHYLRDALKRP